MFIYKDVQEYRGIEHEAMNRKCGRKKINLTKEGGGD